MPEQFKKFDNSFKKEGLEKIKPSKVETPQPIDIELTSTEDEHKLKKKEILKKPLNYIKNTKINTKV